jgi:hypothetical protein
VRARPDQPRRLSCRLSGHFFSIYDSRSGKNGERRCGKDGDTELRPAVEEDVWDPIAFLFSF